MGEDKLKFAFMMFDENHWNTLNKADVADVLKAMAPQIGEREREEHVSRLYAQYSLHPRDRVNQRQFSEYVMDYAEDFIPGIPKKPQASEKEDEEESTEGDSKSSSQLSNADETLAAQGAEVSE